MQGTNSRKRITTTYLGVKTSTCKMTTSNCCRLGPSFRIRFIEVEKWRIGSEISLRPKDVGLQIIEWKHSNEKLLLCGTFLRFIDRRFAFQFGNY